MRSTTRILAAMGHSLRWTVADIPLQTGRRYLVTGSNSGIGYQTAAALVRRGATVLMAVRDRTRGEAALRRLQAETGRLSNPNGGTAALAALDLSSLGSVRSLAEILLGEGLPLHGLILNAGVWEPPVRTETADGYELQFGTNVLGHFALTCRLLPLLAKVCSADPARAPRVVSVASIAHKFGKIDFDDLQSTRRYKPRVAYGQSKLGNLLFAAELDRRLRAAGTGVVSTAAHPGVADTNLFKVGTFSPLESRLRALGGRLIGMLLNSDVQGALPTLYAATAPTAEPGGYYGPQGWLEMRGGDVGPAELRPQARDEAAAARLWGVCEQLSGVRLDLRRCTATA